jgi:hypothetical protein
VLPALHQLHQFPINCLREFLALYKEYPPPINYRQSTAISQSDQFTSEQLHLTLPAYIMEQSHQITIVIYFINARPDVGPARCQVCRLQLFDFVNSTMAKRSGYIDWNVRVVRAIGRYADITGTCD